MIDKYHYQTHGQIKIEKTGKGMAMPAFKVHSKEIFKIRSHASGDKSGDRDIRKPE